MPAAITNERLLGLLAFVVAVAYCPDASVLRWSIAAFGLCLLALARPPRIELTGAHLIALVLLLWALLSLLWTTSLYDGGFELLQWELVALPAFILGASASSLRPLYVGLSLGIAVNLGVVAVQLMGFEPVFNAATPSGLFGNRHVLSEIAVLALVGCAACRVWWACPAPLLVVLLTQERTALLALLVVGIVYVGKRLPWLGAGLAALLGAGLIAYLATLPALSSFGDRMAYWQDTIDGLRLAGRGIGSFFTAWPLHTEHYQALLNSIAPDSNTAPWRPDHAHNDFLETAFELGAIGIVALVLLFVAGMGRLEQPENFVVVALAVECGATFPLHQPATLMVGLLAVGRAAAASGAFCRLLQRGRVACAAWLGSDDEECAS